MNYDFMFENLEGKFSSKFKGLNQALGVEENLFNVNTVLSVYTPSIYSNFARNQYKFAGSPNNSPLERKTNEVHSDKMGKYISKWVVYAMNGYIDNRIPERILELISTKEYTRLNNCGVYLNYPKIDNQLNYYMNFMRNPKNSDGQKAYEAERLTGLMLIALDRDTNVHLKMLDFYRAVNTGFQFKTEMEMQMFDDDFIDTLVYTLKVTPGVPLDLGNHKELTANFENSNKQDANYLKNTLKVIKNEIKKSESVTEEKTNSYYETTFRQVAL